MENTTTHEAQVAAEGACFRARCTCGWVGRRLSDEWKARHYAAKHTLIHLRRREATR